MGPIPFGGAVYTSAGRLPYKGIIHVAGINMLWRASAASIEDSVTNAVRLAEQHHLKTVAFPIIGAGSRGFDATSVERLMRNTFAALQSPVHVTLVRYRKR